MRQEFVYTTKLIINAAKKIINVLETRSNRVIIKHCKKNRITLNMFLFLIKIY